MKDSDRNRYSASVAGLEAEQLQTKLKESIAAVRGNFPPNTGALVVVFDFGGTGKGLGYIANAPRDQMISTLRELITQLTLQSKMS